MTVDLLALTKAELGTTTLTDEKIQSKINEAIQELKNYCNRTDITDDMAYLIRDMAIVLLSDSATEQEIDTMKIGDISVKYNTSGISSSIFDDFKSKLNKFRKFLI